MNEKMCVPIYISRLKPHLGSSAVERPLVYSSTGSRTWVQIPLEGKTERAAKGPFLASVFFFIDQFSL
jgi:hypothetical protein